MSPTHKLSLKAAIFINMNIMLGSGIFINTSILAKQAGILGALSYVIIGILMLPLMMSIAQLLKIHPSGGFYTFGAREIHPFAGFLGTWGYITGKLASVVIMIHISVSLIQQIIPLLSTINTLLFDAFVLTLFICLNMFDLRTGNKIQTFFLCFKLVPILFGILSGFYLFSGQTLATAPVCLESIPFTLPFVLFAIAGFEAACSLSSRIQDAHHNAPRAVYISYGLVILLTTLFQFMLYSGLGEQLVNAVDYRFVFPALIGKLLPDAPTIGSNLIALLHLAIASSALGGSYGILFSNNWNIYTLAQHNHLLGSSALTQMNKFQIPWLCVIAEGAIGFLFLIITRGSQIPLQQIGALGSIIAYTMSAIALLCAVSRRNDVAISRWVPTLALGNCLMLIATSIYNLVCNGASSLVLYGCLLMVGIVMFFITREKSIAA